MHSINKLNNLKYDKLLSIEQVEITNIDDRPEVTNTLRKVIFFIVAEGFLRTLAKIASKRNKNLDIKKYLTKVKIEKDNIQYINYSTQTSKNINDFVIKNEFYEITIDNQNIENTDTIQYNQYINTKLVSNQNTPTTLHYHNDNTNFTDRIIFKEGVFIYGLGDYARVYIAPNIKKIKKIFCVDYISQLAKHYKSEYNYMYSGIVPQESYKTIEKVEKPLAIIATYHSDHTIIAKEIFHKNPNTLIFIEKPPCVTLEDISTLLELYLNNAKIEIGYNRRHIPINKKIKERLKGQTAIINISVKEILIKENHWYFWENQGTRITGNLTHWIDICNFWLEEEIPIELNMLKSSTKDETFTASILYSKGSLVNLTVSDKGNPLRGVQEKIEIRTKDETYFIDDYQRYYIISKNGKKRTTRKRIRIKGHDEMYRHLVQLYTQNGETQYRPIDLIKTALTTYYLSQMFINNTKNMSVESKINSMLKNYDLNS